MFKSIKTPRFFLKDNLNQITDTEQVLQIIKVLRLKINDYIIGIHDTREYLFKIGQIQKNLIQLELIKENENNNELPFNLKVFLPLLKNEKNEFILQKLTELGINEFQFVEFEHSVKQAKNWEHKVERWQKIILEALEQSERIKIPLLQAPIKLESINLKQDEKGFIFMERLDSENNSTLSLLNNSNHKALIFGPEGGFSEKEKEIILQKGFIPISLGKRILRAETAIILGSGLCTLN